MASRGQDQHASIPGQGVVAGRFGPGVPSHHLIYENVSVSFVPQEEPGAALADETFLRVPHPPAALWAGARLLVSRSDGRRLLLIPHNSPSPTSPSGSFSLEGGEEVTALLPPFNAL